MNKTNKKTMPSTKVFIFSCIAAIILGTILHFTYDFLNKPFIIGLFVPVNESIWEHLKLVFIPIITFGILYNIFSKNIKEKNSNFWYYILRSILLAMIIIVFGYYSYKWMFKTVPDIFNILLYIAAMIISFYKLYTCIKKQNICKKEITTKNKLGIISIIFICILFILFTIYPPQLKLFRDPINNTFGIFML